MVLFQTIPIVLLDKLYPWHSPFLAIVMYFSFRGNSHLKGMRGLTGDHGDIGPQGAPVSLW